MKSKKKRHVNCYEKCSFLTLADQQLDLFSEQPFARLCSFSNGIARMIDSSINMFKDHINLEGTDVTQHLNKTDRASHHADPQNERQTRQHTRKQAT